MTAATPVEVAVGVLIGSDGQFLLAERPPGKPYAGYWEFPGGKVEQGESVAQALRRELHEELGLDIDAVSPWVTREHVYPHAHVRLHFCRVWDWHGEPHGREAQAFGFFSLTNLPDGPLLEGALPVMPWLALPARCRLTRAPGLDTFGPSDELVLRPLSAGDGMHWWQEAGADTRRGCQVSDRCGADAAVKAGAAFLIVVDALAAPVLAESPVPVYLLANQGASLAAARARGAHGLARVVDELAN
jgi:8-oxo-dGTP diphosphatase